jgi:hypothetical protein
VCQLAGFSGFEHNCGYGVKSIPATLHAGISEEIANLDDPYVLFLGFYQEALGESSGKR